jgi:hypothetical protein
MTARDNERPAAAKRDKQHSREGRGETTVADEKGASPPLPEKAAVTADHQPGPEHDAASVRT